METETQCELDQWPAKWGAGRISQEICETGQFNRTNFLALNFHVFISTWIHLPFLHKPPSPTLLSPCLHLVMSQV